MGWDVGAAAAFSFLPPAAAAAVGRASMWRNWRWRWRWRSSLALLRQSGLWLLLGERVPRCRRAPTRQYFRVSSHFFIDRLSMKRCWRHSSSLPLEASRGPYRSRVFERGGRLPSVFFAFINCTIVLFSSWKGKGGRGCERAGGELWAAAVLG